MVKIPVICFHSDQNILILCICMPLCVWGVGERERRERERNPILKIKTWLNTATLGRLLERMQTRVWSPELWTL